MKQLYFVAIYKGSTLIACYSSTKGNFIKCTNELVKKIQQNSRLCFKADSFGFITFSDDEFKFIAMVEDGYKQRVAETFLALVKKYFYEKINKVNNNNGSGSINDTGSSSQLNLTNIQQQMQPILKQLLELYNTEQCDDYLKVQADIEQTQEIFQQNLEKFFERGQKVDLLLEQSNDMVDLATELRKTARKIKQVMWWRKIKFYIYLVLILLILAYIGLVVLCGDFALSGCFGNKGGGSQPTPVPSPNSNITNLTQDATFSSMMSAETNKSSLNILLPKCMRQLSKQPANQSSENGATKRNFQDDKATIDLRKEKSEN